MILMYLWIWTLLCVWTCMYPWTFVCELACEFGLLWTCMYMWTVLCLKLMWCWSVNLLYHVSSSCCVNVEKIVVRNHKACSCMPDCWSWDRSSLCCCNCKQAWNEKEKKGKRPGRPQKLLSPQARGHRTRSTILSAVWLAQQKHVDKKKESSQRPDTLHACARARAQRPCLCMRPAPAACMCQHQGQKGLFKHHLTLLADRVDCGVILRMKVQVCVK